MKNILKILIILQILVQTNCTEIPDDLLNEASLKGCESIFDNTTHFCYDGDVYAMCGGIRYNPTTHICQGSVANPARCNGSQYNPLEYGCCAFRMFSLADQRCQSDVVETKCGTGWYDAANANLRCQSNVIEAKCGIGWYNATLSENCYDGIKSSVTYESQTYKTIGIGSQMWMAENLNYNAQGSTCKSAGNYDSDCNTYGRLYPWATAMDLPEDCRTTSCASQINEKHRGVCPVGWHIPSDDAWEVLMNFVGGSSTTSRHLRATSGWNDNDNGLDTYGFAALPGGYDVDGYGQNALGVVGVFGSGGNWWSSTETDSHVWLNSTDDGYYVWFRYIDGYNAGKTSGTKSGWMFSVRCVQD
jgi:uncharacterized protein (TIGR02145 family)